MSMYGSLDEANTYFLENDFEVEWEGFTNPRKIQALNRATQIIDELPLQGRKYITTQDNEFPRTWHYQGISTVWDQDLDTGVIEVPADVEHAAYWQARFMLMRNKAGSKTRYKAQKAGVTSLSVGSTSESYDLSKIGFDRETGLCEDAMRLIRKYLLEYM